MKKKMTEIASSFIQIVGVKRQRHLESPPLIGV
jgi:hypothetical protein